MLAYLHGELGLELRAGTTAHGFNAAHLAARGGHVGEIYSYPLSYSNPLGVLEYLQQHASDTLSTVARPSLRSPLQLAEMHKNAECSRFLKENIVHFDVK